MDEYVLEPLGLAAGTVTADPPHDQRLVARTLFGRPLTPWTLNGPILPSGGLWSTPRTMASVLVGLLVERRLGPPAPRGARENRRRCGTTEPHTGRPPSPSHTTTAAGSCSTACTATAHAPTAWQSKSSRPPVPPGPGHDPRVSSTPSAILKASSSPASIRQEVSRERSAGTSEPRRQSAPNTRARRSLGSRKPPAGGVSVSERRSPTGAGTAATQSKAASAPAMRERDAAPRVAS
ncbi:hypothetical protein [Streptomyces sp. NBC_00454]|uniref:hypothetical protein n=1 Tax=Streptomyces sp. NBC_00454 TaxID=2975747 RepID=UPI002F91A44F